VIGDVTLASGRRASYYVDVRRAVLLPGVFADIGLLLSEIAVQVQASAVGGVPVGAIPVACAALAAASAGVPTTLTRAFIIRDEPKGHGLRRAIEGPQLQRGERCLLVEDVVTTGGSTVRVLERLASEQVEIAGVACVLDRLAGGREAIAAVTDAPFRSLTSIDEVYPERPDR
jgi:orotate phosphoribosyltransferase